ncbi:CLAVATA3/ESR (CLE)-related protein 25 [Lotus japonicus]|uniref:CLAVATA3/ESR (CLE)-related protein 25 n=1 Tax=Lotus japonicus TaxID=34305 RepID=UPI00258FB3C1|nr:CLAVATA3/ESR (CLE)-related protein 25 [Lotus japonicus]
MPLPSISTSHCHWVESHKRNQDMGVGGVSLRRLLLGALVSVGVIWFMFLVAISVNSKTKRTVLVPINVISKHLKLVGMQRHALHSNSGMIFVSKRRVPNGPDPIHNRKAVKYRQPPTQA